MQIPPGEPNTVGENDTTTANAILLDGTYRAERLRVPVEEVFVVGQRVVVAQLGDGLVSVAVPEPAQPSVRKPL